MIEAGQNFDLVVAKKTIGLDTNYLMNIKTRDMIALLKDNSNHPTISSIAHYHDNVKLIGLIGICVSMVSEIATVRRGFNGDMSMYTLLSQLLLLKHPSATMADIKLCLVQNAGSPLFDRFDANVFIGWMDKFMEDKLTTAEMTQQIKHEQVRKEATVPMPKEIVEKMKLLEKKQESDKVQEILSRKRKFYSLEQYAIAQGEDLDTVEEKIEENCRHAWDKDDKEKYEVVGITYLQYKTLFANKFLRDHSE